MRWFVRRFCHADSAHRSCEYERIISERLNAEKKSLLFDTSWEHQVVQCLDSAAKEVEHSGRNVAGANLKHQNLFAIFLG
jgi:hypothetical protein